jgi:hypothetical protein
MEYSQKVLDVLHGTGAGATATATGDGATGQWRRSIDFDCVATATGQRRRSIAIAMAMGKEDWGTGARATEQCCNRTVIAMGQQQRLIVFYIAAQNVDNSGW